MINKNKFDTDLSSDIEPFGYIEDRKAVKTERA